MYFFTADEHYRHERILQYCGRPYRTIRDMEECLIANHNRIVVPGDVTVHCGDFGFFKSAREAQEVIGRLRGSHVFLKGSHDRWLPSSAKFMWRKMIDDQFVVACHYALRTWERACHGAWQVYGHSHGTLAPIGKQWDVGVDCNEFTPVSFEKLRVVMEGQQMEHDVPL